MSKRAVKVARGALLIPRGPHIRETGRVVKVAVSLTKAFNIGHRRGNEQLAIPAD